eukprot:NODE_518_length_1653_cov_72.005611_g430_i0.p1 GENE.NODE_518_length_1653_cov_72.005611_g430_i0~~NODE_518_length_1653_cov_72.005611_g430_i0.p1  ORF type:complete len:443 (-),score=124.69 NODE_518_length_1653_cov_72.005611_g430_i0:80-1408(-)
MVSVHHREKTQLQARQCELLTYIESQAQQLAQRREPVDSEESRRRQQRVEELELELARGTSQAKSPRAQGITFQATEYEIEEVSFDGLCDSPLLALQQDLEHCNETIAKQNDEILELMHKVATLQRQAAVSRSNSLYQSSPTSPPRPSRRLSRCSVTQHSLFAELSTRLESLHRARTDLSQRPSIFKTCSASKLLVEATTPKRPLADLPIVDSCSSSSSMEPTISLDPPSPGWRGVPTLQAELLGTGLSSQTTTPSFAWSRWPGGSAPSTPNTATPLPTTPFGPERFASVHIEEPSRTLLPKGSQRRLKASDGQAEDTTWPQFPKNDLNTSMSQEFISNEPEPDPEPEPGVKVGRLEFLQQLFNIYKRLESTKRNMHASRCTSYYQRLCRTREAADLTQNYNECIQVLAACRGDCSQLIRRHFTKTEKLHVGLSTMWLHSRD